MAVNIHNLIAAISPDVFCDSKVKDEVKDIVEENGPVKGHLKAAGKAKPKSSTYFDFDELYWKNPMSASGIKNPIEKHKVTYDTSTESVEKIYFWMLDALNKDFKDSQRVDKLIDNFISSPGSGHFSELGQKATRMQEEGMKILGGVNNVVKSILNIIYDLKEFEVRLQLYKDLHHGDDETKHSARLSLKQIWMDTVDQKRGNTSIKGMSQQFQYVTIIDSFMACDSLKDVEKFDLNERVKRILAQRVGEFLAWVTNSEKELSKRYEIEKIYLKSQVSTVKLYARWAKPYLKAATQLEQRASPTAALVNTFNTTLFELTLLAESEYEAIDDVGPGNLPRIFLTREKSKQDRSYVPILIVELKFRSIPERTQQGGYGFRGKVDIEFTSYALNDEELDLLRKSIEQDDLGDVLQLIDGITKDSLEHLKEDIDKYLGETKDEKKEKKEHEDTNPFTALFSLFKSEPKKKDKKSEESLPEKDNEYEKVIRSQAIIKARMECRKMYDLYKKANSMPTF